MIRVSIAFFGILVFSFQGENSALYCNILGENGILDIYYSVDNTIPERASTTAIL